MDYNKLPSPVSASEVLKGTAISIEVPNEASEKIGPFERRYSEGFRIAQVSSIRDLQVLGFVHADLREEEAIQAIRADERLYNDWQIRNSQHAYKKCIEPLENHCSCHSQQNEATVLSRRHVQNNLIDVLQPLVADTLTTVHPIVQHSYYHIRRLITRRTALLYVGIFLLEDITIGDHAVLTTTPTVGGLYARNINIGKEGRLRFTGGNVKVRCKELNGPSRFSEIYVPGLHAETLFRRNDI
ncbi:MAG: hypothetical protein EOP04_23915 [Proteobacteria bacterium]|nr:MAG: hypothetical protein EOP04_23915 [Pseudomonadota bacterium]